MSPIDDDTRAQDHRVWLVPIFAAALALSVLLSLQGTLELRAAGRDIPFLWLLRENVPYWLMWAAAAPVFFVSSRAIRRRFRHAGIQIALHAGVVLGLMLVHSALLYASQVALAVTDLRLPLWKGAIAVARWRFPTNLLVFGSLVALLFGTEARRRTDAATRRAHERDMHTARLAGQLATARLHALRVQLNPHFLFNALNSVAMLVRRGDGTEAVRALAGVSELLRQLLSESDAVEVTLEHELAFVRRYLAIEQARFGDALQVEWDVSPETLDAHVPTLILQPIVENAVRHGVAGAREPGCVRIATSRDNGQLVLEVSDNGPGPTHERDGRTRHHHAGLGIRNTVERLTHLHGDRCDFHLRNDGFGGVATITLPFSRTPVVERSA